MAEKKAAKTKETNDAKISKGLIGGLVCAAVAIIAIVLVIVCVNGGNKVTGTYTLTNISENGEDQSAMLSLMEAFGGGKAKLEMKADKTCSLSLFSEKVECTYDNKYIYPKQDTSADNAAEDSGSITLLGDISDKDAKQEYSFKDNKITLKQNDTEMVFTKD